MPLKATSTQLASLTIPPVHAMLFGSPNPAEITRVADHLATNGLLDPLHVSADNLIGIGLKQFLAAQTLGWETIDVYLHPDWADPATIERQIIADKLNHRPSSLERARCARRLIELDEQCAIDDLSQWRLRSAQARLKRDVTEQTDLASREVNRILQVVRTPLPVQLACESGKLPLTLAVKVATFPADVQQEVADEIQAGFDPKTTVSSRVPLKAIAPKGATDVYTHLLRAAQKAVAELAGNEATIKTSEKTCEENIKALTDLRDLINTCIRHEKADDSKRRKGTAALMVALNGINGRISAQ